MACSALAGHAELVADSAEPSVAAADCCSCCRCWTLLWTAAAAVVAAAAAAVVVDAAVAADGLGVRPPSAAPCGTAGAPGSAVAFEARAVCDKKKGRESEYL